MDRVVTVGRIILVDLAGPVVRRDLVVRAVRRDLVARRDPAALAVLLDLEGRAARAIRVAAAVLIAVGAGDNRSTPCDPVRD
jgi:tRNA pseudouridine-54 N-methylase